MRACTARWKPDERASFLFNGAVNTFEQGGLVVLIYGRHLVGSKVISDGIITEDLAIPTQEVQAWPILKVDDAEAPDGE